MDINTVRTTVTVVSFVVFIGIVMWAWSGRNKARFEEAARTPFNEDDRDDGETR
jgi:cytochrome c oxidase cbb3-type subunit 4